MAKRLSEQLADLSVRVKKAEDAVNAAESEAHEEIVIRREEARDAAIIANDKVTKQIKSIGDGIAKSWNAARDKIAADMTALRSDVAEARKDIDAELAEDNAERLEWEAGLAVDYAIASVEQARLALLDAVDARVAADQLQRA